jgi:hypothetical protein
MKSLATLLAVVALSAGASAQQQKQEAISAFLQGVQIGREKQAVIEETWKMNTTFKIYCMLSSGSFSKTFAPRSGRRVCWQLFPNGFPPSPGRNCG